MHPAEASPYSITFPSAMLMSDITAHQLQRKCCICTVVDPTIANTTSVLQLPATTTEKPPVSATETDSLLYPSTP